MGLHMLRADSAVPGLTRASVLALPVRLPPDAAMRDFQHATRDLFALKEALAAESAQLRRLRDALLPGLVIGLPMS
jgi:hypothetical protein